MLTDFVPHFREFIIFQTGCVRHLHYDLTFVPAKSLTAQMDGRLNPPQETGKTHHDLSPIQMTSSFTVQTFFALRVYECELLSMILFG
jgi:hypothetical protein